VKLNEFKQLNELDLSHAFGDYGAAALQQVGNRLNPFNKTGSDQLSVQDKMAKNIFISNMIGRASADLDSAIKGGLVDPKLKTNQAPTTPQNTTQPSTTPSTNTQPSTTPSTNTQQAPAGETPEQKRIRLQKAAQQNIDKTAAPFSKLPSNQANTQAGNIRQAKQKVAGANAQSQMAPFSKLPDNQANVQAGNIRQAKQQTAGANAQSQMAPVSKLPADQTAIQAANIRKAKQKAAQANLFKESTYAKLDYILESVININEAVASKQSISDFIQRFFKKYLKVQTIPSQIQSQVTSLANEIQNTYPKNKAALTKLANLGYAFSYSDQDNATNTATAGATQPATSSFAAGIQQGLGKGASASNTATTDAPATSTGSSAPATSNTSSSTTQTAPASTSATAVNPQQEKTVYSQVKGMLDKLDKKGKQRILSALQKSLGDTTSASTPTKASAADPGASAFAQMGKQVTQTGVTNPSATTKTSTGGKVQNTGLGLVNTKSRNNPNIKRRPRVKTEPTATQVPADQTIANRQQKLATRKQKANV
jgi:hypothetical protein